MSLDSPALERGKWGAIPEINQKREGKPLWRGKNMVIQGENKTNTKWTARVIAIPEFGFLRLKEVLQIIPISKSQWWAGVKEGRFPQSIKLGPRTTCWRVEDIRNLVERLSAA